MNEIDPKYLCMLNRKQCDFCYNKSNEYTTTIPLTLNHGYQVCQHCTNVGKHAMQQYSINKHVIGLFQLNRLLSSSHYFNNNTFTYVSINVNNVHERWIIDPTKFIKLRKKKIFFYCTNHIDVKKVSLNELSILNTYINEDEIKDIIYNYLQIL